MVRRARAVRPSRRVQRLHILCSWFSCLIGYTAAIMFGGGEISERKPIANWFYVHRASLLAKKIAKCE